MAHGSNKLLTLIVLIIGLCASTPAQDLEISEFLASNVTDYPEMYDFGDYNDWIELHNLSSTSLDLGNYFLSDDQTQPLKWKLPQATVLEPDAYLIIWADGFNTGPGHDYQRSTWPWETYTTRHYHTNFKLSKSGEELILSQADPGSPQSLINAGSVWHYLDNGSEPSAFWMDTDFDDLTWSQGQAELGYGDGDEVTVLSYGSDPNQKFITSYFRKWFQVDSTAELQSLTLDLKRDDGAVIYLNGQEILRANMPDGPIDYLTLASTAVSSGDESTFFSFSLSAEELVRGPNLLAVEIHQISRTSSDISFDLALSGTGYSNINVVDQLIYGNQITDVSQGRDATGEWVFFGEPTPAAPNLTDPVSFPEIAPPVTCSLASGMYSGPQTVSLGSAEPGADIHFTMDGSKPGSSSPVYTTPLQLDQTTVLRARSFATDKLPGELLTRSFLIDEAGDLTTVSLVAEPRTLWDPDLGIYENEYKQREIPVTLEYFSTDGVHEFSINAGSRLGGLNIWTKPQKPFTIYTRNRFGDDFIQHQIFANKPITEFSRIVLRNGGDDWEETLIRDPMTESLVSDMMDCGYMAYEPSALFLNGEYWGIHNIREKFDTHYFFENFGADPDHIDHLEYAATAAGTQLMVIEGDFEAYNSLLDFIQTQDLNVPEIYSQLQQQMNIDGFIDHLVMTLYSANTSWGHNREWWRPRKVDAQWQWLIVDVDRSFNPGNTNINLVDDLRDSYLLFQYLLPCQAFKDRLVQRAAAHLNNTFAYQRVVTIVDSLSARIAPEMPRHTQRWGSQGGISSMSYWEGQLNDIKQFCEDRPEILRSQLNSELGLSGSFDLTLLVDPPGAGRVLIDEVPALYPGSAASYFKNTPLVLRAEPVIGYRFTGWVAVSDSATITPLCSVDTVFTAVFQASDEVLLPELISSDLILTPGQPYAIVHDLMIPAGVTLTLEAGVELRMPVGGQIIVAGRLLSLGSLTDPVQIISNPATSNARWGGLAFTSSSDTSRMTHTQVRGATKGVDPLLHRGAISSINSHLELDHVDLRSVDFPIFISGGSAVVRNCSIRTESICDFINIKRAAIVLEGCRFYGVDATDTDAIDLDGVTDGLIADNRIYNFGGFNSDGIDIGEETQGVVIRGNLIYNSFDKGISVGQRSNVIIEKNVIVGCTRGVAVKDSSRALIVNNTFFRNDTSIACYVKNEGAGGGSAEVLNCIIAESRSHALFADSQSSITVGYSLADNQMLPGTSNLLAAPLFLDPNAYNLELAEGSPCIDGGDPASPLDGDGSPADIGAYYSYDPLDYPFEIPAQFIHQLLLNEFLASNQNTISDEAGEFDDWLEIFNPTAEFLDLAGLYLTDNPQNLTKWSFPASGTTIEPGGHLLIWCDEDGVQGPLHANFKLSGSGEYLALVDVEGSGIIDSLSFGPQIADISYGRAPDGSDNWCPMTPSPGISNVIPSGLSHGERPIQFNLLPNYPNPFNPLTTIRYEIPTAGPVSFRIYNLRGQLERTLVDGYLPVGSGSIQWNSLDDDGTAVSGGLYFLTMTAGDFRQTRKLVLLK